MKKRKLGRTNLDVSELCLNTTHFDWADDQDASAALLDAYFAAGGTFIQSLGVHSGSERSEFASRSADIVGCWHQSRAIPRDRIVLASRLNLLRPAHGGSIALANLVRECCEASLRRLRTTYLDLLIIDWEESLVPVDDLLEGISQLVRAGLVRYAVASGFPPWRVTDSLHRSTLRNQCRFEAVQSEYSLVTRARFEAEALAMCREHRLGFIARSPLAGGFLARSPRDRDGDEPGRWLAERFGNHYGDTVFSAVSHLAEQRGTTPAQIALAWVLRHPQVTSTLVSAPSVPELHSLLQATQLQLTDDEAAGLAHVTTVQDYRMELRHA